MAMVAGFWLGGAHGAVTGGFATAFGLLGGTAAGIGLVSLVCAAGKTPFPAGSRFAGVSLMVTGLLIAAIRIFPG
jgi:hypothetical protein